MCKYSHFLDNKNFFEKFYIHYSLKNTKGFLNTFKNLLIKQKDLMSFNKKSSRERRLPIFCTEPISGFEPETSSLPRKRSTPELYRQVKKNHIPLRFVIFSLSGRRGSNPRHSAWKADALPTELLPLIKF